MKRIIAILLAALMLLSFAACSKKDQTDAEYIKEKGELVIGITLFAPMDYYEGDELVGFEADFARAVCEKLGLNAKFQEIDWKTKETELSSKNIDCIWNGLTITPERKENMSISIPYMANKQILVAKADRIQEIEQNGLDGLDVVAEIGSAGEEVIQQDAKFAKVKYTGVESMASALRDVKAGTADACVIDYITALGSIGEGTDYADLGKIESLTFADEEYGIAFRKDSDFTEQVNKAIEELAKDGTLMKIAQKYHIEQQLIVK